jgi:catechol 2,3-dioxygenase-like lactoylglutathione lyase family enzyme
MGSDISGLHHVGLVVDDMAAALETLRRLGFALPEPSYPAIAPREGEPPRPFGAANTHADFRRNFLELATYVKPGEAGRVPAEATIVPLQAPPELLPTVVGQIESTSARLATYLDRFEGAHILMLSAPDVSAVAARLTAAHVRHSGVNTVQRPVQTPAGTRVESIHVLELDDADVPEGRVGVVGDLDPDIQGTRVLDHPNGAVELVGATVCAADVDAVLARYETYLDRPAGSDGVFDLNGATLAVLSPSDLDAILPGEQPAALPAIAAYTVAVTDLAGTAEVLRGNGVPHRPTVRGDLFVPAEAALGAAVVFSQVSARRPA